MAQQKGSKVVRAAGALRPWQLSRRYQMKRISADKDIRRLVQKLIGEGWEIKNGKKHHSIISPGGRKIAVPSTPSDYRAIHNFQSDTKRLERIELCLM